MASPERALRWITEILERHCLPYQIVGGLAARAYGATRELNDIDLYMPMSQFGLLLPDVASVITWGPAHEISAHWDLKYVKILYEGQKIEIGDSDATRIFDPVVQHWLKQDIRFDQSVYIEVFNVLVPIMPKEQLISYKSILSRDIDHIDLNQMKRAEG